MRRMGYRDLVGFPALAIADGVSGAPAARGPYA